MASGSLNNQPFFHRGSGDSRKALWGARGYGRLGSVDGDRRTRKEERLGCRPALAWEGPPILSTKGSPQGDHLQLRRMRDGSCSQAQSWPWHSSV